MLQERQKSILDAVIQEYVRTARPVASRELVESFDPEISPATIRGAMLELDKLGYLEQPYTSAGRVPTDKGYRFFVDHLLVESFLSEREKRMLKEAFAYDQEDEFVKEFSKTLSQISRTFAAAGVADEDIFYESGFSKIMGEPEMHEPENALTFGRLVDFLDEEVRGLFEEESEDQIFIGHENPLRDAKEYSMFISSWRHPRGFGGFFTLIGPRRTDYPKHKAVMREIKRVA